MISASTLYDWLHDGEELALFDVREHGQYGEGHLFYAVSLPYSVLETEVQRLAPQRGARMVLVADDETLALQAARQLALLDYRQVEVLAGGVASWVAAGHVLFKGVNLPSKAFGELVEHACGTPHLSAQQLAARQAAGEALLVLDGRPLTEFKKMNIPGAICCPNGELGYRIDDLVSDEDTTIVINCAGRTRSIIGAQTLINLGLKNPVLALENGTQGWFLNDLPLQHGQQRRYPSAVADGKRRLAAALQLATRAGAPLVDAPQVKRWAQDPHRTLFLCDVRTAEEFAAGSLPGARHTPGGQLQQALDLFVGVRHARLVLFDGDDVRALTTASWLRQQGQQAFVLRGGVHSGLTLDRPEPQLTPELPRISVAALAAEHQRDSVNIIDLRPSQVFRKGHIAGSKWSIRSHLQAQLEAVSKPVVLIGDDAQQVAWSVSNLPSAAQQQPLRLLEGSFAAWQAAGLPVHVDATTPADQLCIDYLFFTHDRHDGNKAAAQQYLDWELALLGQIDERDLASFQPLSLA